MLKDTNTPTWKDGDIIGMVLSNGVDGIGKVSSTDEHNIMVSYFKAFVRTPDGGMGVQEYPLNAIKEAPIAVNKDNIIVLYSPHVDIVEQYKASISEIMIPKKGGIII